MTLAAQHLDEAQWAFDSYERMYGLCGDAPPFSELFADAHPECSVGSKVVRHGLEFLDGSALWLNDGQLEVE